MEIEKRKEVKKIKKLLLLLILTAIFLCSGSLAQASEQDSLLQKVKILYIPLDDRPVNMAYVKETLVGTPAHFVLPPDEYLPAENKKVGDTEKLWQWLLTESKKADVAVISADTLVYGGLVPSRTHQLDSKVLEERVERLAQLKKQNPRLKIYLFSTIMRSPKMSKGGVEPDYYTQYGPKIFQITSLQAKEEIEGLSFLEKAQLQSLQYQVPQEYLTDWLERRKKNFAINERLIQLTKDNLIDYFVLCRDDTSVFSQSTKEYQILLKEAQSLQENVWNTLRRFTSFCGADEVGMVLLARAVNRYRTVRVYPFYAPGQGKDTIPNYEDQAVEENVNNHIFAAGAIPETDPTKANLFLGVNTPEDGKTREASDGSNISSADSAIIRFANELGAYLQKGKKVALADIAYSNGADNALMRQLSQRKNLSLLQSYSSWNTAGNSIGYALGQGILVDFLSPERKEKILSTRLLDDWVYQANVRKQINQEILYPQKIDSTALGDGEEKIKEATQKKMDEFSKENIQGINYGSFTISFPWHRMFEIEVKH